MRGCLFVVLLAAALAAAVAWFGAPAVAGVLVEGALRASGFDARTTSVRVVAEPPVEILGGHADRVEIAATDARFDDMTVADLDLSLVDVDLTGARFEEVRGTLGGVTLEQDDRSVPISRIELSGPAGAAVAAVTMDGADSERLAAEALRDRVGSAVSDVRLAAPDRLAFAVAGRPVEGTFVVEADGSLALAIALPGNPRAEILRGDPLRVESVQVLDGDLVLTGEIDLAAVLR